MTARSGHRVQTLNASAARPTAIPEIPLIAVSAANTATPAAGPARQGATGGSVVRPRAGSRAKHARMGSSANPPNNPARYQVLRPKVSVILPPSPAGSTQPCCHPLTRTGVSRCPCASRAAQPGLMLSGTASTRSCADGSAVTSRRSGPQAPFGATVIVAEAGSVVAAVSCTPSTMNCWLGLTVTS
ncbi:Uncharacterised protein [Mycobacteroides abscessus]|nr:Uncharacterised protein [Mycobacteroides abscessus]